MEEFLERLRQLELTNAEVGVERYRHDRHTARREDEEVASSEKRPCQVTLYARFKHKHPTQNVVIWYSEQGVVGPPEKRTLRRD